MNEARVLSNDEEVQVSGGIWPVVASIALAVALYQLRSAYKF